MASSQDRRSLEIARQPGVWQYCELFAFAQLVLSMCRVLAIAAVLSLGLTLLALADDPTFQITMENNQFVPSEVHIPAGTKVKLVVHNDNQTTSEFESNQFHREKVVGPGQGITVYIGPLDPGSYEFFDDFHPQTRGHLVVK